MRYLLVLFIGFGPVGALAKHSICTVTINSPQERNLFQSKLPAKDFQFTELTTFQPKDAPAGGDAWLEKACEAGVQCDVLVVSGHFAGNFFGSSHLSLNLDPMENHACQKSCEGIIKRPKEVFLFGCNTLAAKDKDRRSPEEYLRALVDDQIPLAQAQQIVQARYGSLGDSNRDRMKRIFSGVPRIYGFDSIGPAGNSVTRFLQNYLSTTGDYGQHLAQIEGQDAVNTISKVTAAVQTPAQRTIAAAFRTTSFTQCAGLNEKDPEYPLKSQICPLYNAKLDLKARIAYARELMRGPNATALTPSVMAFIRAHETDVHGNTELTAALRDFGADPIVRNKIDALRANVAGSPQLKIDLERFRSQLGIITPAELMETARGVIRPLFNTLTDHTIGQFCDVASAVGEDTKINLTADDVDLKQVAKPVGTAAFNCVSSDDPRVTAAALRSLEHPDPNVENRKAQVMALQQLPGQGAGKVRALLPLVTAKDADMASSANQMVFEFGEGRVRREAFDRLIKTGHDDYAITQAIARAQIRDDELANAALDVGIRAPSRAFSAAQMMASLTDAQSSLWPKAMSKGSDEVRAAVLYEWTGRDQHESHMTDWVIERTAAGDPTGRLADPMAKYLSGVQLTASQTSRVVQLIKDHPDSAHNLRLVLHDHASQSLTREQRELVQGPMSGYRCHRAEQGYSCSVVLEQLKAD